ncbi:hypothetical protein [Actinacidiphila soli]|uniref:hypothetical protein n=1 Tax=Actinacidiphila soli TaxID=2487275 RepID=UPI0019D2A8CC|nr:hypothetical protein [Actinacidiphila soli]
MINQRIGMETFDQLVRRDMPLGPVTLDQGSKQVGFFLNSRWGECFEAFLARETDGPRRTST